MYLKNKNSEDERCEMCPAGKWSSSKSRRNKKCRKCPKNTYNYREGSDWCEKCPEGFSTRGKRGKQQCFQKGPKKDSLSMKQVGLLPREDGTYRIKGGGLHGSTNTGQ